MQKPTESELEILQIVWQKKSVTVREVNDQLNHEREVGYTTTLKLMQIMHEKGLLSRDETARTHVYKPAVTEAETQALLLNKFVDATYRGSALKLVMQALGTTTVSADDLGQLKQLITDLENKKN